MAVLLQITVIVVNLVLFIQSIRKLKENIRISYIVLLIFQAVFILPMIFDLLFGIEDYSLKYPIYDIVLQDLITDLLYSLIVLIISIGLFFSGSSRKSEFKLREQLLKLNIRKEYIFIAIFLMFLPFVAILLSPSPEKYLFKYAYFQQYPQLATNEEIWFHQNILRISSFISLVSILFVRLYTKRTPFVTLLIYSATITTGILDGKRTLFAFIILGLLAVDILKAPKRKFPYVRVLASMVIIISTFILYASIIDKHVSNLTLLDTIRFYFFRNVDIKYSIYALLNSENVTILEHWGQSYLYNLTFYVPREIWPTKPYPYDLYYTNSVLGLPINEIPPFFFQTSIFGEALSNLGWIGIVFSLFILHKFIQISEKTENPFVILLSIFIIAKSYMNHFISFALYLIVWIILMILVKTILKSNKE